MLLGMAHHFAISLGAFCIGRICSNFACIRGGGSLNSPYEWLSAFHVDSKLILFQNGDLYKSLLGCDNYHYAFTHGPPSCYFAFSHRAQGKWGSFFYALSKPVIIYLILNGARANIRRNCNVHSTITMFRYRFMEMQRFAAPKI